MFFTDWISNGRWSLLFLSEAFRRPFGGLFRQKPKLVSLGEILVSLGGKLVSLGERRKLSAGPGKEGNFRSAYRMEVHFGKFRKIGKKESFRRGQSISLKPLNKKFGKSERKKVSDGVRVYNGSLILEIFGKSERKKVSDGVRVYVTS